MSSDEMAVMNPIIHELKGTLMSADDWCAAFTVENDEDSWIQIADGVVNLSMVNAALSVEQVEELFSRKGFQTEVANYEAGSFLTINLVWAEHTRALTQALDQIFVSHFSQSEEYSLDCEIYEI